jgi:hypothetical protein
LYTDAKNASLYSFQASGEFVAPQEAVDCDFFDGFRGVARGRLEAFHQMYVRLIRDAGGLRELFDDRIFKRTEKWWSDYSAPRARQHFPSTPRPAMSPSSESSWIACSPSPSPSRQMEPTRAGRGVGLSPPLVPGGSVAGKVLRTRRRVVGGTIPAADRGLAAASAFASPLTGVHGGIGQMRLRDAGAATDLVAEARHPQAGRTFILC